MTPCNAPCFFVLGYGRSGTTLLRRMLSAHPRLFVPPENDMCLRLVPHLKAPLQSEADADRLLALFPRYYRRVFNISRFHEEAAARLPLNVPDVFALLNMTARISEQMAMMDYVARAEMAALDYAPRAAEAAGLAKHMACDAACGGLDTAWAGLRATRRLRGQL